MRLALFPEYWKFNVGSKNAKKKKKNAASNFQFFRQYDLNWSRQILSINTTILVVGRKRAIKQS